jgi:hypothetical protein
LKGVKNEERVTCRERDVVWSDISNVTAGKCKKPKKNLDHDELSGN